MKISWACKWVGCGRRQSTEVEAYGPTIAHCDKCKKASRLVVSKRADGKAVAIDSRPTPED